MILTKSNRKISENRLINKSVCDIFSMFMKYRGVIVLKKIITLVSSVVMLTGCVAGALGSEETVSLTAL